MNADAVARPGVLDVAEGVAFTCAVVMVGALPPVSTEFAVAPSAIGVTVGVGMLGALGLLVAFVAGSFRSRRVLPAAGLFLAGVALWVVAVVYADPQLGWRVGIVTVWLAAAVLVAAAWFVLRRYPARVYPALLFVAAGAGLASVAPSHAMFVAALAGGAAATFVVTLLVMRAASTPRQRSAAL